ncbi:peptide deformylase, partial [Dysosmobacter welbionis]
LQLLAAVGADDLAVLQDGLVEVDGLLAGGAGGGVAVLVLLRLLILVYILFVLVILAEDGVLHILQVIADSVQAVVQLLLVRLHIRDLQGDVVQHVDDGGKQLALLLLGVQFHAFSQALQIRDLLRNLHNSSSFPLQT